MEALKVDLMTSALSVQDELLGVTEDFDPVGVRVEVPVGDGVATDLSPVQRDSLHVTNGLTPQSWFFHSPLQYWGCSKEKLSNDADILTTVNKQKNLSTSAGMTLRHSIVFSGKRFEDRRLLAADALVVTLLHLRDSPVGHQWERKANASSLLSRFGDEWDIYSPDERAPDSQLYEFQFRPISLQDSISLTLAYGLTIGYFFISLSKLRAIKSKFGLMVAVTSQVALSVMSSFTICAVLNMDLSRIPRAAYPLAILSMSLENVFRLINAVILTHAEDSTSNRIGQAWGETAPVAMASTAQNVAILLGLSRLVSDGVSVFCVFAAVAIVFDFFFLSTFFLSVLSVDVRRVELSDALDKAAILHTRLGNPTSRERHNIFNRVLEGKLALSTRIAGTIVTIGFVLIAQWHFFDDEPMLKTLSRLWKRGEHIKSQAWPINSPLHELHQARSPTSWLRMQDHETAEEVIKIIKPSAYSYIAQVFEPVVFVLKGSDRTPRGRQHALLPAAYDFVNHELSRAIVIVIVLLAGVRLLTSFLLWDEEEHNALQAEYQAEHDSLLSVKALAGGHALDIAMLCRSSEGHIVSVGLDRLIRVWNIRDVRQSYIVVDGRQDKRELFPVLGITIDDQSDWLVILSTLRVDFWNLRNKTWARPVQLDSRGRRVEVVYSSSRGRTMPPHVTVVWRNGTLTETSPALEGPIVECTISTTPITFAQIYEDNDDGLLTASLSNSSSSDERPDDVSDGVAVITSTKDGKIHRTWHGKRGWLTRLLAHVDCQDRDGVHQLQVFPSLQTLVVASSNHVRIVSLESGNVYFIFRVENMLPRSLRCILTPLRSAADTGPAELSSIVLCYTGRESGECVLRTYLPADGFETIALTELDKAMDNLYDKKVVAQVISKSVANPGAWELLCDGYVVGIRRIVLEPGTRPGDGPRSAPGLRQRFSSYHKGHVALIPEHWEMWMASTGNKTDVEDARPLVKAAEGPGRLIVPGIGPRTTVGLASVAFGFGNVIKLVTVGGQQRFEASNDGITRNSGRNPGRRRKSSGLGLRSGS